MHDTHPLPKETVGKFKIPDPAIRKDHSPGVDHGAVVQPKHKACILYTMFYRANEPPVSEFLMHKYKLYIPKNKYSKLL